MTFHCIFLFFLNCVQSFKTMNQFRNVLYFWLFQYEIFLLSCKILSDLYPHCHCFYHDYSCYPVSKPRIDIITKLISSPNWNHWLYRYKHLVWSSKKKREKPLRLIWISGRHMFYLGVRLWGHFYLLRRKSDRYPEKTVFLQLKYTLP